MREYKLNRVSTILVCLTLILAGCRTSGGTAGSTQPTSAGGTLKVAKFKTVQSPSKETAAIALSPNGKLLACGVYGDSSVYILDASTGGTTLTLKGHTSPVTSLVFSPNGDLLATTGTVNLPPNRDGAVRIWDVKSGNQLAVFKTPGISQLSFSPDGSLLAGAGGGDPLQVTIWDVANRSEKRTLKGIFKCVSFNPGGNLLASGSRDDQLHLVNAAAVEEPRILSGHAGWVDATVFSPQGGTLASGGEDNNVIVWDSATGNKVQTFSGHQSGIGFLAFSPDGNVLVSLGSGTNVTRQGNQISVTMGPKDKSLRFWDIKAGKELLHVDEPDGISGVSLSSDWGLMATSSGKDVIQLWSISL